MPNNLPDGLRTVSLSSVFERYLAENDGVIQSIYHFYQWAKTTSTPAASTSMHWVSAPLGSMGGYTLVLRQASGVRFVLRHADTGHEMQLLTIQPVSEQHIQRSLYSFVLYTPETARGRAIARFGNAGIAEFISRITKVKVELEGTRGIGEQSYTYPIATVPVTFGAEGRARFATLNGRRVNFLEDGTFVPGIVRTFAPLVET